jgi:hypothetical protein
MGLERVSNAAKGRSSTRESRDVVLRGGVAELELESLKRYVVYRS